MSDPRPRGDDDRHVNQLTTNPGSDANESSGGINRRSALKTLAGASAGVIGGSSLLQMASNPASAMVAGPPGGGGGKGYKWKKTRRDRDIDNQWDSGGPFKYVGQLSASLAYIGPILIQGEWRHIFDSSSTFSVARNNRYNNAGFQTVEHVGGTEIVIQGTDNSTLLANAADDDIGAHPKPQSSNGGDGQPEWGAVPLIVVQAALGSAAAATGYGGVFTVGSTAANILGAMVSDVNQTEDNPNRKKFTMNYDLDGAESADATNRAAFEVSCDSGSVADFTLQQRAYSNANSAINCEVEWNKQVDANEYEPID